MMWEESQLKYMTIPKTVNKEICYKHVIFFIDSLRVLNHYESHQAKIIIRKSCCFIIITVVFNIQKLYILPTLYLCVLYLSENKERIVPLTA
jgi:hypothetical protein